MQTIYFKDHRKSGDDGYDLNRFFTDLDTKKDVRIVFECDEYHASPDYAAERLLYVSNHGWNGLKRIAVLLEDMENVELDFSGSTLITHGVMTHFALLNCKNVTIRNLTIDNPSTMFLQARVSAHGDGYVDLEKSIGKESFRVNRHGELTIDYLESTFTVNTAIEYRHDTGEIEYGTNDFPFDDHFPHLRFEELGNDMLRVHGVKRYPPIGNIEILYIYPRLGCGFFMEDCSDVYIENVTVHGCLGMGVLAQTCHNVHLNSFNTLRHGDRHYTANVDATHFVNCTGLVKVENCTFEGQLDDALNIHGMYARIERVCGNEIFVREVHNQSKGIRIYRDGDKIQAVNVNSLIPYTEKTIEKAEYLNQDMIRLVLLEDASDIKVGDNIENIDRNADLIFKNNTGRNNRARGMRIATRGKVIIEDCYFHTSGSAILFESNGSYWFESGGTTDVTVQNNFFDRCKYTVWGVSVISCVPRMAIEEEKYFHKNIRIDNNEFKTTFDYLIQFDNVENISFKGNRVSCNEDVSPKITLKHIKNADIDDSLIVERL